MSKQEERYNLVTEYQSSCLSAKSFSKKGEKSPATFGFWVRKKKEEDHSGGFAEVVPLKSSVSEMELICPNGGKLQMSSPELAWSLRGPAHLTLFLIS